MKQETAIEWLIEQLKNMEYDLRLIPNTIQQAKAMEKQQIINAYKEGCFDNILDESTDSIRAEEYYEETYNQPK
jgi:hypothetical protein